MQKLIEMKGLLAEMERDFEKFYVKGNDSAGVRIRLGMQRVKEIAAEIRTEVQEKRKSK